MSANDPSGAGRAGEPDAGAVGRGAGDVDTGDDRDGGPPAAAVETVDPASEAYGALGRVDREAEWTRRSGGPDAAVVSFYHDHGVDVRDRPIWNVGAEWRERLASTDPWCVVVATTLGGERLVCYLDRDAEVVETRRHDAAAAS